MQKNQAILIKKQKLTQDVFLLKFKLKNKLIFQPGQYIIVKINNKPRAYSIASSKFKSNQLDLIIKIIPNGLASTYFLNLFVNSKIEFFGPYGQFVLKNNSNKKIFLATGTGIAPFLSMIKSFENFSFTLYWGLKKFNDVFLIEEFNALKEKNKNFNFKICLSQELNTNNLNKEIFDFGHVDNCFLKDFKNKNINNFEFYICGYKEIVISIKNQLIKNNVNNKNIIIEKF